MGNRASKTPHMRKMEASSGSITIPSICDRESNLIALYPTLTVEVEEVDKDSNFSFSRMQNVFLEHSLINCEREVVINRTIIKSAAFAFEMLRRHMKDLCLQLSAETLKLPDTIVSRFEGNPDPKYPVKETTIMHIATVIFTHLKILGLFREGLEEVAVNFLRQVAVSHALLGVQYTDFKIMDMFLVHYLILNQLINDECIDNTISYLTNITRHITNFFEAQSIRNSMITALLAKDKKNDRLNKARENYRLMKKWRKFQEIIRKERAGIEDIWTHEDEPDQAAQDDDTVTIDTETLKEQDCIMKNFVKKKKAGK